MGKLDTVYKVFRTMHSKEILSGNAEITGNQNNNQVVLLKGDFTYDVKDDLAKIDAKSKVNLESLKKDYDFVGNLKLSDFSSNIDEHQHKLPGVTTILKIFSDLKIEEIDGDKVLTSSIDKLIAKIKKDHFKGPIEDIDYSLSGSDVENVKNILKILINEFFKMNYESIIARSFLNKHNEIYKVEIVGSGSDDFKIKLNLSY